MNRRLFVRTLAALSPLAFLSGHLNPPLLKLYRKWRGEREELRSYVMFNFFGAPARWVFDNVLTPNGDSDTLELNGHYTNYVASNTENYDPIFSKVEYSTVPHNGQYVPALWRSNIFFRGQLKPMTGLLDHMLMIRGVRQGNSSHTIGNEKQICVRSGELSISGMVADSSTRPIPAVHLGASPAGSAFFSNNGKAQLSLDYGEGESTKNIYDYITSPFFGNSFSPQTEDKLKLPKNFDVNAEYEKTLNKYKDIVLNTRQQCPIPGLNDRPITTPEFAFKTKDELMAALRKMKLGSRYVIERNYSNTLSGVEIGQNNFFEKQFALAEFLLVNKISSSIVLSPPRGTGCILTNIRTSKTVTSDENLVIKEEKGLFKVDMEKTRFEPENTHSLVMDPHNSGSFYVIQGSSLLFQGISACLLELVQTLKDHSTPQDNLFENVVIHLASEYDRICFKDDGETDHSSESNPTSLISGLIKQYNCIGNISIKSRTGYNNSTVGQSAPVEELGGIHLLTEHVLSSITTVLGGPEISFRHPSILQVEGNEIVTKLKKPKNV